MNPPFFTILTASLNNGVTLEETLISIKDQTFKSYEHIVIDGGSSDKTGSLLKQYSASYNLRYVSEKDGGIAEALNKGIHLAKGRYIVVIHADDKLLNKTVLDKVGSDLADEKTDIKCYKIRFDHPIKGEIGRKPIKLLWWNRFKFIFLHQGCFVHKRVFDEIGNFNEMYKISFDYDFLYRAVLTDKKIAFGDCPVALMGGSGIGSVAETVVERLAEEKRVQQANEPNNIWRFLQTVFWTAYIPYKKLLLKFREVPK